MQSVALASLLVASLHTAFDQMPAPAEGRVEVLADNTDAWVERWRALENAKKSIDVTYFIVEGDAFGLSFLGLLDEKQREGVDVRLMLDSRGTGALTRPFAGLHVIEALAADGVEVRVYNRLEQRLPETLFAADARKAVASNHDKIILVDGTTAIVGGRNITEHYFANPLDFKKAYIDMDVRIDGASSAAALERAFNVERTNPVASAVEGVKHEPSKETLALATAAMRVWMNAPALSDREADRLLEDKTARENVALELVGSVIGPLAKVPSAEAESTLKNVARMLAENPRLRGALRREPPGLSPKAPVRVLDTTSAAEKNRGHITGNLLAAIENARRNIVIESAYFVLTDRGLAALEKASKRGVQISILTNSPVSGDNALAEAAFLDQWQGMLARVPTAQLYVVGVPRLMHAKVVTVDDTVAFVGSYNIDPLSSDVDGEVMTAIWSKDVARTLHTLFTHALEQGAPDVYRYSNKPPFGPEDHCDAATMAKVNMVKPVLGLIAPLI